jgi:hypothetical protein
MYMYCRELEIAHKEYVEEIIRKSGRGLTPDTETYIKGIEYFVRGNEIRSRWTPRYNFGVDQE